MTKSRYLFSQKYSIVDVRLESKRASVIHGLFIVSYKNCVKNVCIWSFSFPYSVRMRGNKDQKNSE